MKTKASAFFFVHFAAYAFNHMEYLKLENYIGQKFGFYDDKTNITKARGREGFHREYIYKLGTLEDVVKLGMCLGYIIADINNGIHVQIEIK